VGAVARVVLCVVRAVPAVLAQSPPRVEELRERATAYVEDFLTRFSQLVCEERMVQESTSLPSVSGSGTNAKMEAPTPGKREIRSDYLFVRRQATEDWITFRDAFEVNGRPVRDRADRLVKLLANPSLENEALARRLMLESTRHQLNPVLRSVNDPLLVLVFLQNRYQARFRYTRGARDRKVGDDVWIVNYREQEWPSIIRVGGGDALSRGRLYSFGRTDYRATATYSRFRRFDVSTSEKVQDK
jgi:hypothetical protein